MPFTEKEIKDEKDESVKFFNEYYFPTITLIIITGCIKYLIQIIQINN